MTAPTGHRNYDRLASLILDDGVLDVDEVLEIGSYQAVQVRGGIALLPRRDRHLAAHAAGVAAVSLPGELGDSAYRQVVVHLEKGRAATHWALAVAWRHLTPDGRLFLVGGNDLGIKSAVRRLARDLGQPPTVLANRARARVASFVRTDQPGPRLETPASIPIDTGGHRLEVVTAPGAFSADAIDPGSRLLLEHLDETTSPTTLFDPGSGLGVLGLAALLRFPNADAHLAEIDRRAIEASRVSADRLGVLDRCRFSWWDATSEPPPVASCDFVVLNPPFHSGGAAVDLGPAFAMFHAVGTALKPGGTALVVANRTLPYEKPLSTLGVLDRIAERDGYKLLRVRRLR